MVDQPATAFSAPRQSAVSGPTAWPLVVAIAAVLLGLTLLWWGRDPSNEFAWPFLGAAIVITTIASGAWMVDDSRSRRRALALGDRARASRYTQVVTFAIADGQLATARAAGGVLAALDESDTALRALPGFQDIRVVVSPSTSGPSQALCETTWWDRGSLAIYDQTTKTVLDVLNAHTDEVLPGSVQVFDMEVVRDAKEVSVRLGMASAIGLLAAVLVGGLAIGAGLSAFTETTTVAGPAQSEEPIVGGPITVSASGNKFDVASLEAEAGKEFAVTLKNKDAVPHNIHFLDKQGGQTLAPGAEGKIIKKGESETLKFTVPTTGTYYFQCDVHPDLMKGPFTVK